MPRPMLESTKLSGSMLQAQVTTPLIGSTKRGGFRYLSLLHNTTGGIEVQQVTVQFTPMPHWQDNKLGDYTGYFHCNDELVNRIWYAGAYTNQLCTIDPNHGNALVHFDEVTSESNQTMTDTWWNNATITNGSSSLVDGAKRDRLVLAWRTCTLQFPLSRCHTTT